MSVQEIFLVFCEVMDFSSVEFNNLFEFAPKRYKPVLTSGAAANMVIIVRHWNDLDLSKYTANQLKSICVLPFPHFPLQSRGLIMVEPVEKLVTKMIEKACKGNFLSERPTLFCSMRRDFKQPLFHPDKGIKK